MNKDKREQLEKEFAEEFSQYTKVSGLAREVSNRDYKILDWWLSKLDEILKDKKERIKNILIEAIKVQRVKLFCDSCYQEQKYDDSFSYIVCGCSFTVSKAIKILEE